MPATVWIGETESKPAPAPLDLVQSLVNTVELPGGPDRLLARGDARPWLIAGGLLGDDAEVTEEDLTETRAVREALRALLVHNAGGPAPTERDLAPLRRVAERAAMRAGLADDGSVTLSGADDSLRGRLGTLLLRIRDAQRDGTWSRLKACGNDECRWAFYDRSRNHGGTWCDMSTCGNKLKNREFRARRRANPR